MTWFEVLTGFQETSPSEVRQNLTVDGETLTSHVNGKVMVCGRLETPSLAELRERVQSGGHGRGHLSVREVVADSQALHADVSNAGALFQVASQFNLLEMVSPSLTPEHGVGIYENDHTQGPACAIAAGAGTIYRNYFAPVNGQIGQSANNQIDCLADLGRGLGQADHRLWQMRNGYALASRRGLIEISKRLSTSSEDALDELRKLLRIGMQWHTQVTFRDFTHQVSQAYCSALPVAYSQQPPALWADFSRLILEAAYEATLCAAILNERSTGNNRVFLTLLGDGAFGNETQWITAAIKRGLQLYQAWNIEVVIVSYGGSKAYVRQLVGQFA
ncbi:hypothetical protein BH10CHL1_BH10CHL1_42190 [soil metagenome]